MNKNAIIKELRELETFAELLEARVDRLKQVCSEFRKSVENTKPKIRKKKYAKTFNKSFI